MNWTDKEKLAVWRKGKQEPGYNPSQYRKDCCGAWMEWDEYGNDQSDFGWEIDHVYPKVELEKHGVPEEEWHHIDNLRPMNHSNNESKGDDYPKYKSAVTSFERSNVNKSEIYTVNEHQRKAIDTLYWWYLYNEDDIDLE